MRLSAEAGDYLFAVAAAAAASGVSGFSLAVG
jgi:hypothetical protein